MSIRQVSLLVYTNAMVIPRAAPIEGESACSARELEEYEDIREDAKLEDCGSVEVEMRNGEMGVKYVKDGEVGWTPVVRRRRKKSTRSVRRVRVVGM